MRNFLTALAIFITISATCHAAEKMTVCDFGVHDFCSRYDVLHRATSLPETSTIKENGIITSEEDGFDMVLLPLKNVTDETGTAIGLVVDKSDRIWGITMINRDRATQNDMVAAFLLSLIAIGLDEKDIDELTDDLKENDRADKFFASISRYLKVEAMALENDELGVIEISAHGD